MLRMRTKKRSTNAPSSDSPNSGVTPNLTDTADNTGEKPNRISFNVTAEGIPDWERMLPRTKIQLTELLTNKTVQEKLGISPTEAKEVLLTGFGEDESNALLDLLSGINSVAASRIYQVPTEVTSVAFSFSADHRKKINPPLTRILNKWGPAVIKTWKDEIGLGIVFLSVLNAQVRLMHILEEQRKKKQPRPVTPISKTEPEQKPVEPATVPG